MVGAPEELCAWGWEMSETNNRCPKCGSDSYDTVKHEWRDGLPPFDDYHECCSCDHEWVDTNQDQETKASDA